MVFQILESADLSIDKGDARWYAVTTVPALQNFAYSFSQHDFAKGVMISPTKG